MGKNDKIRMSIQRIIDGGGVDFMSLPDLIELVELNLIKRGGGPTRIGTHQLTNILREFNVERKYKTAPGNGGTKFPWIKLCGGEHDE